MLFSKLQLLVVKTIRNKFCCILLLYLWAQKVCLRFVNLLFQIGDIKGIVMKIICQQIYDRFNTNNIY